MPIRIDWRGEEVRRKVLQASRMGIDDTMAAATIDAKQNHPGWQNRTGTAEGSIRITEPAHEDAHGMVGRWGSMGVNYFIWLELKYGAALRNAAGHIYPSLKRRIQAHMSR